MTLLLPRNPPSSPTGPSNNPPAAAFPRPNPFRFAVNCVLLQRGHRTGSSSSSYMTFIFKVNLPDEFSYIHQSYQGRVVALDCLDIEFVGVFRLWYGNHHHH